MKAVLISINPKWCDLIALGKKTIEVRKTKPKMEPPFMCYIYCTTGGRYGRTTRLADALFFGDGKEPSNGKVIGEFVCDKVFPINVFTNGTIQNYMFYEMERSCVAYDDIVKYIGNGCTGWGWHISDMAIYDKPRGLSEFMKPCENDLYCEVCAMYSEFTERCLNAALQISKAPQSWCYVEGGEG